MRRTGLAVGSHGREFECLLPIASREVPRGSQSHVQSRPPRRPSPELPRELRANGISGIATRRRSKNPRQLQSKSPPPVEEPTPIPVEEPTQVPVEEGATTAPQEEGAPVEEPTKPPVEEALRHPRGGRPAARRRITPPAEEPPAEEPPTADSSVPGEEPTPVPVEEPTPAPAEEPTPVTGEEPTPPAEEPTQAPVEEPRTSGRGTEGGPHAESCHRR